MTGGELRELAAELRGRADKCRGHLLQMMSVSYELAEQAANVLERLADEQEAAPKVLSCSTRCWQDAEAQAAPSEPESGGSTSDGSHDTEWTDARPGSLDAEAAVIRTYIIHAAREPWHQAEDALAALDRLLAGKAAG